MRNFKNYRWRMQRYMMMKNADSMILDSMISGTIICSISCNSSINKVFLISFFNITMVVQI